MAAHDESGIQLQAGDIGDQFTGVIGRQRTDADDPAVR
jgi:hypothetical protein